MTPFFGKDTVRTTGVMYRSPEGTLSLVIERNRYYFPNGCAISPDGALFYLSDSADTTVWVYDIEAGGSLANRRSFSSLSMNPVEGREGALRSSADGMAVDSAGNVFVTSRRGLHVFEPSGKDLGILEFSENPSNCVFGGEDLKTLYVTCRKRIYAIRTNIPGISLP